MSLCRSIAAASRPTASAGPAHPMPSASRRALRPRHAPTLSALLLALLVATPRQPAEAQRRPGQNFGFYTTTGLLTGDLDIGSVTSSSAFAEAPTVALSALVTTRVRQRPKRAWIVGVRGTMLSLGNSDPCIDGSRIPGCQDRRFTERVALVAGGAFDIRSTLLRVMVGPAWYGIQGGDQRIGTQLRVDYAAPRLRGSTPTLFFSRSMLGSERGESVGLSTLGIGFRWVRRR